MANEFKIADAQKVLDRLKTEIKTSEQWRKEKDDLLGLLSMVVNMPNLIKENETLEKAIDKNRTMITNIEEEVAEKKVWADGRHQVLDKQILDKETLLTEKGNEIGKRIADMQDDLNEKVKAFQANAGSQMREVDDKIKAKKEILAKITSECDAAENRLRLFKENIASIPVDL